MTRLTPMQALAARMRRTPKRHSWPIPPGTNVLRFNDILAKNLEKLQAGDVELAFVLPDFGLTAPFESGNEFLVEVDRALIAWTARLGDLLTFNPNKRIMNARDFKDEDTSFINGVYLVCGHPVTYRELRRAILNQERNPRA